MITPDTSEVRGFQNPVFQRPAAPNTGSARDIAATAEIRAALSLAAARVIFAMIIGMFVIRVIIGVLVTVVIAMIVTVVIFTAMRILGPAPLRAAVPACASAASAVTGFLFIGMLRKNRSTAQNRKHAAQKKAPID